MKNVSVACRGVAFFPDQVRFISATKHPVFFTHVSRTVVSAAASPLSALPESLAPARARGFPVKKLIQFIRSVAHPPANKTEKKKMDEPLSN